MKFLIYAALLVFAAGICLPGLAGIIVNSVLLGGILLAWGLRKLWQLRKG